MRVGVAAALSVLVTGCHSTLDLLAPDPDLVVVAGTTLAVNDCRAVTGISGSVLTLSSAMEAIAGDLLVVQMQEGFAASGDSASVTSEVTAAGSWELAAIADASGTTVTLDVAPAGFVFAGGASVQACTRPRYRDVTVAFGARIAATPWNGGAGGIVAFAASGTVRVDGEIAASGAGFRGGLLRADDDSQGITSLDTVGGLGGGKGEGLDGRSRALSGRGNFANGGGGGNAHNAGGGGGGGRGAGGIGGRQWPDLDGSLDEPLTSGLGGAVVELGDALFLGGGGGAGHQSESIGGAGGNGGGLIWISAAVLSGDGAIRSDGTAGQTAGIAPNGNGDGAGGGGAGGLIRIEAASVDFAGDVSAHGGVGGDTALPDYDLGLGPGGGGGGGYVLTDGWDASGADVAGGGSGLFYGMTVTTSWGAQPGDGGALGTLP